MIDRTAPPMRYEMIEVTAPAVEPISTATAKTHLRVDGSTDDTLIDNLVIAARQTVESFTGRKLIDQTWQALYDDFPRLDRPIELPVAPIDSLTHVKYNDENGDQQTLATSVYISNMDVTPAVIWLDDGEVWPDTYKRGLDVEVQFKAGYGEAGSDVPEALLQALLLLVGTWYENREHVVIGAGAAVVPDTVDYLLAPFKVRRVT